MGRWVFRWLSQFATGQHIPDINSGLRVFRRQEILPFFPVISSGFSFTTTCTLVYLLNDSFVHYVPIRISSADGKVERAGTSGMDCARCKLSWKQYFAVIRSDFPVAGISDHGGWDWTRSFADCSHKAGLLDRVEF